MKKDIVIIGCGAFSRDVLWLLHQQNTTGEEWRILGFVGQSEASHIHGYPVLGDDDWLLSYDGDICAVLAVANPLLKKKIARSYQDAHHIHFPPIVAVTAQVGLNITMGKGTIICANAIIPIDCTIGDFVTVNLGCILEHDTIIGDYATLAPSVTVCGWVNIESCCDIGVGANIIQKIRIGENSVVGAGAAVVKDVPPDCTVVGVPAKPIQ